MYLDKEIQTLLTTEQYPHIDIETRQLLSQMIASEVVLVIKADQEKMPASSALYRYYTEAQEFIAKAFKVSELDLKKKPEASQKSSDDFALEIVDIQNFSQNVSRVIVQGLTQKADYHKGTLSVQAPYGFMAFSRISALVEAHFRIDENKQQVKPKM